MAFQVQCCHAFQCCRTRQPVNLLLVIQDSEDHLSSPTLRRGLWGKSFCFPSVNENHRRQYLLRLRKPDVFPLDCSLFYYADPFVRFIVDGSILWIHNHSHGEVKVKVEATAPQVAYSADRHSLSDSFIISPISMTRDGVQIYVRMMVGAFVLRSR